MFMRKIISLVVCLVLISTVFYNKTILVLSTSDESIPIVFLSSEGVKITYPLKGGTIDGSFSQKFSWVDSMNSAYYKLTMYNDLNQYNYKDEISHDKYYNFMDNVLKQGSYMFVVEGFDSNNNRLSVDMTAFDVIYPTSKPTPKPTSTSIPIANGIAFPEIKPEEVYIRVGQTRNIYDYINYFKYEVDEKVYKFTNNRTASSSLKTVTKYIQSTDRNTFYDNYNAYSINNDGDITGLVKSKYGGQLHFAFDDLGYGIAVTLNVLDSKPSITSEYFQIAWYIDDNNKNAVDLEYPDNTMNHQYRINDGKWENLDTSYIRKSDVTHFKNGMIETNYYEGTINVDGNCKIDIRCQGIGGNEWSDLFSWTITDFDTPTPTNMIISTPTSTPLPINTPTCTFTYTPTTTPTSMPTPTVVPQTNNFLIGDVDGSKKVNSDDYAYMRQYLIGIIGQFPDANWGLNAADVDGDGNFDSDDYAYMRQWLIGMISRFPCELK
jgi:hypothetical protein